MILITLYTPMDLCRKTWSTHRVDNTNLYRDFNKLTSRLSIAPVSEPWSPHPGDNTSYAIKYIFFYRVYCRSTRGYTNHL